VTFGQQAGKQAKIGEMPIEPKREGSEETLPFFFGSTGISPIFACLQGFFYEMREKPKRWRRSLVTGG
jgi:hypothetical protein